MHAGDKIAAAILASAAIKTIPGTRLNSMELQDLYRHFLQIVEDTSVKPSHTRLTAEISNGQSRQTEEPIGIGSA
jgi:hypothetical protein